MNTSNPNLLAIYALDLAQLLRFECFQHIVAVILHGVDKHTMLMLMMVMRCQCVTVAMISMTMPNYDRWLCVAANFRLSQLYFIAHLQSKPQIHEHNQSFPFDATIRLKTIFNFFFCSFFRHQTFIIRFFFLSFVHFNEARTHTRTFHTHTHTHVKLFSVGVALLIHSIFFSVRFSIAPFAISETSSRTNCGFAVEMNGMANNLKSKYRINLN